MKICIYFRFIRGFLRILFLLSFLVHSADASPDISNIEEAYTADAFSDCQLSDAEVLHFDVSSDSLFSESEADQSSTEEDMDENNDNIDECLKNGLTFGDKFKNQLRQWALRFHITLIALSALLLLLQPLVNFPLPLDAKRLLGTMRKVNIFNISGGEYYHFGLKRAVWLILVSDINAQEVYLVGAYYGETKPNDANQFLEEFVNELIDICENGLEGEQVRINCSAFICDAPAKSFVLYLKGHTGYDSCPKCCISGKYVEPEGKHKVIKKKARRKEEFAFQDWSVYTKNR